MLALSDLPMFENALAERVTAPRWLGVEKYEVRTNLVRPDFQVLVGSTLLEDKRDVSPYVSDISDGQIVLHGTALAGELKGDAAYFPRVIQVKSGGNSIFTGHLIRASSTPYANGRTLTLVPLSFTEFHDVDIEDIDPSGISQPDSEDQYIKALLGRSGFEGEVVTTYTDKYNSNFAKVEFRKTEFWSQAAPKGPGFAPEEVLYRYWNVQAGSTMAEIRNVVNANMLELFDAPDGSLFVSPIIPFPNRSLVSLVIGTGIPGDVAKAASYHTDAYGNYRRDPRLNISTLNLDMDETFTEVEVEGSSNEVSFALHATDATFIQEGQSRAQPYFQKSLPAWIVDSGGGTWPAETAPIPGSAAYNTLAPKDRPWTFQDSAGDLKLYPKTWYDQIHLSFGDDTITNKKISGGNRYVTWMKLRKNTLAELGAFGTEFLSNFASSVPGKTLTGTSPVSWGFAAAATGTIWSQATFEFRVLVPDIEESSLKVEPLLGKYREDFVPKWLNTSIVSSQIAAFKNSKPRKARRVQNGFIAATGSAYAVQQYNKQNALSLYDTDESYTASQLASWLTLKEYLKTRRVELSYAGAHSFTPNQFVAIAKKPYGGEGAYVTEYEVFLILDVSRADAKVGSEAWVRAPAAYVGRVKLNESSVWTAYHGEDLPQVWS